jgi:hypothetical protein
MEYTLSWTWFELTTLVVIGTDWTDSCKSNYQMITAMTTPDLALSSSDITSHGQKDTYLMDFLFFYEEMQ